MSGIRRRADGRLVGGGASLNPAGRGGKRRLVTPSDFRRAIIAISQRPVTVPDEEGNPEDNTLYGWHILNLAIGNPKTRLGSKEFMNLVQRAVADEESARLVWTPLSKIPQEAWEVYRKSLAGRAFAAVERDGNGRFTGSGNPRGRPKKVDSILSLDMAEMMLDSANRRVCPEVAGRPEWMTLFESKVRMLGTASGGTRIATRKWIGEVFAASAKLHRLREEETEAAVIEAWKKRDGGSHAGGIPEKWDGQVSAEPVSEEHVRFWDFVRKGKDEEVRALLASASDIPPVETMPDDILGDNLARALEELGRVSPGGERPAAGRPAPVPGKWLDQDGK